MNLYDRVVKLENKQKEKDIKDKLSQEKKMNRKKVL